MKLVKDSAGVVRVAKGDKSGLGGQFGVKNVPTVKPDFNIDTVDDGGDNGNISFEEYSQHDDLGERFIAGRTAYVAFGAHHPFTIAHETIALKGSRMAAENSADFVQFTTAAFGKTKKHVLPLHVKTKLIEESLGVKPYVVKGPFEMFEKLVLEGYSNIHLLLGEDRSGEEVFHKAAEEYGATLNIVVIPRPTGSVSGTAVRQLVSEGDYSRFSEMVAQNVSSETKIQVFDALKTNLK